MLGTYLKLLHKTQSHNKIGHLGIFNALAEPTGKLHRSLMLKIDWSSLALEVLSITLLSKFLSLIVDSR